MKSTEKKRMSPKPRKEVDTSTYTGRFAVRLRSLREKRGMSVEQLAEASGIPKRTIFNWESDTKIAGIDRLPELAKALEIKTRTLLPEN